MMPKSVISVRGFKLSAPNHLINRKSTIDKCKSKVWNLHQQHQDVNYPGPFYTSPRDQTTLVASPTSGALQHYLPSSRCIRHKTRSNPGVISIPNHSKKKIRQLQNIISFRKKEKNAKTPL